MTTPPKYHSHTKPTTTHKLGQVKSQPSFPNGKPSPFQLNLRDVGWHPDADDAKGDRVEVFIEETVGRDNLGNLIPFPVPKSKGPGGIGAVHFQEPTDPNEQAAFNTWILGEAI